MKIEAGFTMENFRSRLLIYLLSFILLTGSIIEIFGRLEEGRLLREEFQIILQAVEKINQGDYIGMEMSHLKYTSLYPNIKIISRFDGKEHEIIYSKSGYNYRPLKDTKHTPIAVTSFKRVSYEGYIPIKASQGQGFNEYLFFKLAKKRRYGIFSSLYWGLLFCIGMLFSIILLTMESSYKNTIVKPLDSLNKFSTAIANGLKFSPLDIMSPETEILTRNLNLIGEEMNILNSRFKSERAGARQNNALLNLLDYIIGFRENPAKSYKNITKYICSEFNNIVCSSLWLLEPLDNEENKIERKGIYRNTKQFKVDELAGVSRSLVKKVIEEGELKTIRDFQVSPEYSQWRAAYPLAIIVIPIRVRGRIVGGLAIWKVRIPYTEVFNREIVNQFNFIGEIIASMIASLI